MLANMNVKTNARRIVFAVTTAAFLLGCGGALASGGDDDDRGKSPEYTHKPFFDDLLLTSYAYGLEMVGQRLRIAKRFTPNINDPLAYQLKRMHGKNFDRFRGTLAERNSALEAELDGALGGVMDAINAGSNATAAIVKAEGLLAQAYDVVIDPAVQKDQIFTSAVLALLLLANDGIAEAYEDAVHEIWGFPNGWASLQRIRVLYAAIEPLASADSRHDADEMFEEIEELYVTPVPPDPFTPEKAEDAEGVAHQLVAIIEKIVDANLYTGRDHEFLAEHLSGVVSGGCKDFAAGKDRIGTESIYAVLDHYRTNISGPLEVLAPEVRLKASQNFPLLVEVEWDFPFIYTGVGIKQVVEDRGLSNTEKCQELVQMFMDASEALDDD